MTPSELRRIGEALYGPRWQTTLARELGVTDRTVRRWVAGEWPVPEQKAEKILTIAARRGRALMEMAKS